MAKSFLIFSTLLMSLPSLAVVSSSLSTQLKIGNCDKNVSPEAISELRESLSNKACNEYEVIIAEKGEIFPLKRVRVSRDDFLKRFILVEKSPTVTFDKKVYSAADVAYYAHPCSYKEEERNMQRYGFVESFACKSNFEVLKSSSKSPEWYFDRFSLINDPNFKQARTLCLEKIETSLKDKVENYIKSNGGKVVSFKKTQDYFKGSVEDLLNWHTLEVEVMNNGKKSVLSLWYLLDEKSKISYTTSETDPFGEYYRHSERSGKVLVDTKPYRGSWNLAEDPKKTQLKGSEAALINTSTGIFISKFELPELSCSEEFLFNQDNKSGPELDNSERGNGKTNSVAPVAKPKASQASQQ